MFPRAAFSSNFSERFSSTTRIYCRCAALASLVLWVLGCALSGNAQTVTKSSTQGPTPSGLQPGVSAGSYALSGFDNINYFSGSLNFRLPLLTVGGRGAAQYTMTLPIERHWSVRSQGHYESCFGTQICFHWDYWYPEHTSTEQPDFSPGAMSGKHTGIAATPCINTSQGYSTTLTILTFKTPDGSQVELRDKAHGGRPLPANPCNSSTDQQPRGRVFTSTDGSSITFVSDAEIRDYWQYSEFAPTGYLMMRDGTRYRIVTGRVKWMRDRNGNQLDFTYEIENQYGVSGRVVLVTDSLGRQVTISYRSDTQAYDQISFAGTNGEPRTIRVGGTPSLRSDYQPLTWAQAFSELNGTSQWTGGPGASGPSYVELPDGRRYRFFYNQYGELARVELPTGGAYEYDWAAGYGGPGSGAYANHSDGGGGVYRRITARRVYANGGTGGAYDSKMAASRNGAVTTVKQYAPGDVLLARSDHHYYGDPSYVPSSPLTFPDWKDGLEYQTDLFATNETTLLRRVVNNWQPRAAASGGTGWQTPAADPRLVETATTLEPNGVNLVTKQSFSYSQDLHNNQTDTYEYDYSAGAAPAYPKRHIHTDYLTINSVNGINYADPANGTTYTITDPHLRSLPQTQQVYSVNELDGTETLVAESATHYDEYSLLAYGPTTGWSNPGTAARGNLTTTRRWLNTTNTWLETHAEYDQVGNVWKSSDARADRPDAERVTQVEYSSAYQYAYPTRVVTPVPDLSGQRGSSVAFETTTSYDFSTGLVTSTTDANGQTTTYSYADDLGNPDPLDRLRKVTRPNGGGWTSYEYGDAPGNLHIRTRTAIDTARATDAYQYFDGLGRPLRAYAYDGSAPERAWSVANTEYDALSRVRRASNPYFAPDRSGGTAPTEWTTTDYDALGRMRAVTTPDGAVLRTDYDGARVLVTDQAGKQRLSQTDALGRLTDVWEIRPADPPATEAVSFPGHAEVAAGYRTTYDYGALDNLRTVTQGAQQTRTFVYDSLKRLTSAQNPESGMITYGYDANSNLERKTDARGVTTTYAYDGLNRVIARTYSDGTPAVTDTYDAAGVSGGILNSKGRLTQVSSSVSTYKYTQYDALGRVKASSQSVDGQTYAMAYGYDWAGNLISETYPSGRIVTTSVKQAGRLASVTGQKAGEANKTYASSFGYAAHGATREMRLGNGRWEHTVFNSRLQPVEIGLGTANTDASLLRLDYNYGVVENGTPDPAKNNGNLASQTINAPGLTLVQSYTYDELNRLKTARELRGTAEAWQQTFAYDRFGNRRFDAAGTTLPQITPENESSTNPAISMSDNRISAAGHRYDAAGNLECDPLHPCGPAPSYASYYTYDAENKLKTAANNVAYSYDGDGRRVKKVVGGVATLFVYDVEGRLVAEYSNVAPAQNGTQYLTADHLGSPRVVTKANGDIAARHDYGPFGEEVGAGIGGRTTGQGYSQVDNVRQKFTGQERDNETGLDYFRARYYSNSQGRFTSVDPENAGAEPDDPQSWNGYAYARNSPLVYGDPSGTTYKLCTSEGCTFHSDENVDAWKKQDGVVFKDQKIFDKDGNQLGTYERTNFDDQNEQFNRMVFGLQRMGPAMEKSILYATGANLAVPTLIVGSGALAGGSITTLGVAEVTAGTTARAAINALIKSAGQLTKLSSGAQQGFIRGNPQQILQNLTQGATKLPSGAFRLADGTFVKLYTSSTSGHASLSIKVAGQYFKLRIIP